MDQEWNPEKFRPWYKSNAIILIAYSLRSTRQIGNYPVKYNERGETSLFQFID